MPYALSHDVPADAQTYRAVRAAIGDDPPHGLVVHLVFEVEDGLRHIGVWDTEAHWRRFRDERSEPAVHAVLSASGVGVMPPDPPSEELQVVDVWLPSRAAVPGPR